MNKSASTPKSGEKVTMERGSKRKFMFYLELRVVE
jgi:hypothetical protein